MTTNMAEGHSKVPKVQEVLLGVTFARDQLVVMVQPVEPTEYDSYRPKGKMLPIITLPVNESPAKEIAKAIQRKRLKAIAGFVPDARSAIKRLMDAIFADPMPGSAPDPSKQ